MGFVRGTWYDLGSDWWMLRGGFYQTLWPLSLVTELLEESVDAAEELSS